jgi:hypothetical protein
LSDDVLQAIADVLKVADPSSLEAYYTRIIPDAIGRAYQDILTALRGRGYTVARVNDWGSNAVYNRDIALNWALTLAGGLGAYTDQQIVKLDRRLELGKISLSDASGNVLIPAGGDGSGWNGTGAPDEFGGAAVGGGRSDQKFWRTSLDTPV